MHRINAILEDEYVGPDGPLPPLTPKVQLRDEHSIKRGHEPIPHRDHRTDQPTERDGG